MISVKKLCVILLIGMPVAVQADIGGLMRQGNALARQGKYEEAIKKYQEALVQEPDNNKIHHNLGRALYHNKKYHEAEAEYQICLLTRNRRFQAQALYNIGNCQFQQGNLEGAIKSYSASLILNPKDRQAKQNLELCQKIKEQMKNQPQNDSTQQNQQQKPSAESQTQSEPAPGEISRQDADRILQALQSQEQKNRKDNREKTQPEQVEKDW